MQNRDDPYSHGENFGIWALRWSTDGRELLAGTGNDSLYLYDVTTSQARRASAREPPVLASEAPRSATVPVKLCTPCAEVMLRSSAVIKLLLCSSRYRKCTGCPPQVTVQIKGHTDDVNAIAYLDDSNNILISGSDDTLVKVCCF